eukprot:TRINITY_DN11310_c0_g1_i1.p1 TRINITY_DN11310_c0_g1~~TRINITY_DN11310_c0_g1_i1.p1  ORF type:complete len:262 (+),score=72.08 TRINITY_DN11310_c0_g1_i1:161-946(+)
MCIRDSQRRVRGIVCPTMSKKPSSRKEKAPVFKPPAGAMRPLAHWRIEIKKEEELIGKYNVSKKPFFLMGRHENCDIQGAQPSLSRHQCALVYLESGFVLIDLKSLHGTFVNGERLQPHEENPIVSGDYITLGKSSRRYYLQWVDEGDNPPPPKRVKTLDGGVQIETVVKKKLSAAQIQKIKDKKEGKKAAVPSLRKAMGSHFDTNKSTIIQPTLLVPEGELEEEAKSPELQPKKDTNAVTGISLGLRKEEVVYSDDSDSD